MEADCEKLVAKLAALFQRHKGRIVVYTGAGISTSASIPDYRGTNGLWVTPKASASSGNSKSSNKCKPGAKRKQNVTTDTWKLRLPEATMACPTYTHMALRVLVKSGYVRHIVSQNVDGLHVRSGLSRKRLSELHGNLFFEQCLLCYSIIMRAFDVAETTGRNQHLTGRICPKCRVSIPDRWLKAAEALDSSVKIPREPNSLQPSESVVRAYKSAASKLAKVATSDKTKNPVLTTLPFLRDVIVHYYERQASSALTKVYRVAEAIEAIHGRNPIRAAVSASLQQPTDTEEPPTLLHAPWFKRMLPAFQASHSVEQPSTKTATSDTDWDDPATLIVVMGSSLSVLRSYGFLWPQGLGRCLHEVPSTSRRRQIVPDWTEPVGCRLAIINLQPTCKDGLADLVIHAHCDRVLESLMRDYLALDVPGYDYKLDDPLYRHAIPLEPEEECTRTRPNIPFHLFKSEVERT